MSPSGRVLVVDDDDVIREVVVSFLGDEGYEVLGARDGRTALALLTTAPAPPSLILLDLRMAGLDGHAFAAAYHRLPAPRAPVLLFSAATEAPAQMDVLGAVGVLPKPFDLEELLAAVRRHAVPPA